MHSAVLACHAMRLDHVHVSGNQAVSGGGVANIGGMLKVVDSVLDGNTVPPPQQQTIATTLVQTDQPLQPLDQGSPDLDGGDGGGIINQDGGPRPSSTTPSSSTRAPSRAAGSTTTARTPKTA
jgi:hypothetical protein